MNLPSKSSTTKGKLLLTRRNFIFFIFTLVVLGYWYGTQIHHEQAEKSATPDSISQNGPVETRSGKPITRCDVNHFGCFMRKTALDQDALVTTNREISRDKCVEYCSDNAKQYAGLTSGDTCMCADRAHHLIEMNNSNDCDITCACDGGCDDIDTCGGENSVDLFLLNRPCDKERITKDQVEGRYIGCFERDQNSHQILELTIQHPNGGNHVFSSVDCLEACENNKQPIAALSSYNDVCQCGRFTKRFNIDHRISKMRCSWPTLGEIQRFDIYKTRIDDERCSRTAFYPMGNMSKWDLLTMASFPGSGSTWTRYLIERATGYFTGCVHSGKAATGLITQDNPMVGGVVLKVHDGGRSAGEFYAAYILLIRNPYEAHLSNYNRMKTASHTDHLTEYNVTDFRKKCASTLPKFYAVIAHAVASGRRCHVIFYDRLKRDPVGEIRRAAKFVGVPRDPDLLEERLRCLSATTEGLNKRAVHVEPRGLYDDVTKKFVNGEIEKAKRSLASIGVAMPDYRRP